MLLYDQNNHTSWTTHHMEQHYSKTQNPPDKAKRKMVAELRDSNIWVNYWLTKSIVWREGKKMQD